MLMPDRIIFVALLSCIIDYFRIQFNYSIVSLFIFMNLLGLYHIIRNIHIRFDVRYGNVNTI